MLAVKSKQRASTTCVPNVLPCRIDHNGPVNASERYWAPTKDCKVDDKETSYFRGRKLHGRSVKIPEGYQGIVVTTTEHQLSDNGNRNRLSDVTSKDVRLCEDDEEGDKLETQDTKVLEENASFDEIVVWGHEAVPETENDPYLRSLDEWIAFAETMHSYPSSKLAKSHEPKEVG
ncbi:MAG: 3'-5' exonuclease [Candelina mexicana]|nr:MAG: 3'-5' exonuclease [Candelina mexicana]